jgi:hypothetical protein
MCIDKSNTNTDNDGVIYPHITTSSTGTKLDIITSKGQCRALCSDIMNGFIYSTYEISSSVNSAINTSSLIKLTTDIDNNTTNNKKSIEIIDHDEDFNDNNNSLAITSNIVDSNKSNKSGAFPHILTGLNDVILILDTKY